jgi:hypothetical protein
MTGSGEFAGALVGVTLRQYQKANSGGSWQKILEFLDSGLCTYCELHHDISDGGRRAEPEHGRWTVSGDFPVGHVWIIWVDGSATEHNIEYYDENSCLFDGVVTAIE